MLENKKSERFIKVGSMIKFDNTKFGEKMTHTALENDILDVLAKGACNRNHLVAELQVARTTIYGHLAKLMVRNVVRSYPLYEEGHKGRPTVMFAIVENLKEIDEQPFKNTIFNIN